MSWAIGYDDNWERDIGYGVPAYCDYPGCGADIDRGLAYVCGGLPYGGDKGCGLYFCSDHLKLSLKYNQRCEKCRQNESPFTPSKDHPDWIRHKLTDKSWAKWRKENRNEVKKLKHETEAWKSDS